MTTFRVVVTPDWDWQALYVDGKCVHQGHDIPEHVWMEYLDAGEPIEVDAEAFGWHFPDDFSDLKLESATSVDRE